MLVVPTSLWSDDQITGLIAHWNFDEGTGTMTADSSVFGNEGVLVNGPSWTDGKVGSALYFSGAGDYVDFGSPATLRPAFFTLSTWFKSTTGGMIFRSFGRGMGVQLGVGDNFGAPGKISFWTYGSSKKSGITSSESYNDDKWHHVAATFEASMISLYIDGVLIGSTTGEMVYQANFITIGSDGGVDNYFKGAIDDFRIYNRALAVSEIQQLYANPAPASDPTPTPALPGFPIPSTPNLTPPGATPTTGPPVLSNGKGWIDSWDGMHSFVVFAPRGNYPDAFISSLATRYDFGWSPLTYRALTLGNPKFVSGTYYDSTQGRDTLEWYQANHPDWILYTCDRVTPVVQYSYKAVTIDFTNPEVIDYKLAELINGDVVAWDNFTLSNDGHACGVWDINGNWIQKFAGVGSYAEVNDPQWTDGIIAYAAAVRQRLHDAPNPKMLIVNTDVKIVAGDPVRSANLSAAVDGVLVEGGRYSQAAIGDPRQIWLNNIHFVEAMNNAGKAYYSLEFADWISTLGIDFRQFIQFTLASYLLAKGHAAGLDIIPPAASLNYDNSDGIFWPAEFQAATAIGTPCNPMAQVAGIFHTEEGMFMREHSGGVSIVNTSRTNSYTVNLPSGSSYRDLYGSIVASTVTLQPATGQVLLKTNSGSCSSQQ